MVTDPHPMPRLQTDRLQLRVPELSDIPEVIRYYRENEGHLGRFDIQRPVDFYTEKYWSERIPIVHQAYRSDQGLRLYLFDRRTEKEMIGTLEFSQIVRGVFQACYLGYGIGAKSEGKGLMFEALTAAIGHAFDEMNLHRIMANHLPDNERSANLLRRLGFVREGVAQQYLRIGGVWRDHILNSLTNLHWKDPSGPRS